MNIRKARYADSRPVTKVLQWMGTVALLTLLSIAVLLLLQRLSGWDMADVRMLKTIQALQTVSIFVLPPLAVAYLWAEQPVRWLHLQKSSCPASLWLLVPLSILIAAPAINLLAHLNQQMSLPAFLQPIEDLMQAKEKEAEYLTERFLRVSTVGGLLVNILIMALLPALGEEMTFRGLLFNAFTSQNVTRARVHLTIWCVAVLFSAVHLQFYGFIPRMLIGAYLGYLLVWTDSLWMPVLAHFTNNAFAVIASFIALRCQADTAFLESLGTGDTLWLGILSFCLTAVLIACICKIAVRQHRK